MHAPLHRDTREGRFLFVLKRYGFILKAPYSFHSVDNMHSDVSLSLYMCLFVLSHVFGWNTFQSNVQSWSFSILHNIAHFLSFWHLKFQGCNQSLLVRCRSDWASQVALVVKNQLARAADVRDVGSVPGLGRSPGGGHGNLLQYFCLENPTDRGAWWPTVHSVQRVRHD